MNSESEPLSSRVATEPLERLLRDLRTRREGLHPSEVEHRLAVHGTNEVARRGGRHWPRQLARQFVHPFALLLIGAAGLALVDRTPVLAVAIFAVVIVNAVVAFAQERHAERAVEMLRGYLPQAARVLRGGRLSEIPAREVVPGDVVVIDEGARIPADARLLEGSVEIDLSSLTGESVTVTRAAQLIDVNAPLLRTRDVVFSGTNCVGGNATAVVFATGMRTELGRIAALSERVSHERSPLERQVLRLAEVIAVVGLVAALTFLALGIFAAKLPAGDALAFSIGLLVANVPEGLLPTLTLALALAVRVLARTGALVKRLSAVETLGAATVICTDKTGTLTANRMTVTELWRLGKSERITGDGAALSREQWKSAARVMSACNLATVNPDEPEHGLGDPTEVALLRAAGVLGEEVDEDVRRLRRRAIFRFDPDLKLMSTVEDGEGSVVYTKGAPEEVLARCDFVLDADDEVRPLSRAIRERVFSAVEEHAGRGLRVLALGRRPLDGDVTEQRDVIERGLTFVGLVGLFDPPRSEVPAAIASCQRAGIRVIMITGDHAATAAAVARQVGLSDDVPLVLNGAEVDRMPDERLRATLRSSRPLVFARALPETKLRITDALKAEGHVVAMTGDGVNDAPALRRADIGVAMGRSGTDVAREAATVVLMDDNFATIVAAISEGRRVYQNIRKFIVYILAHLTPEVIPFLLFALSGGAIPLPITVLQILAIDLGTETLPALALGRERAEPGIMEQAPRKRSASIVEVPLLLRAWILLGGVSTALVLSAFFFTLWRGGWEFGASVVPGSRLHQTYLAATTVTFLGIVVCQIGTALAARTERVSLFRVGVFKNHLLLWGIAFELLLAALLVYVPPLSTVFSTAPPPADSLLLLAPFPFLVWGVDELYRWRRRGRRESAEGRPGAPGREEPRAGETGRRKMQPTG